MAVAVAYLLSSLDDPDADVRQGAVRALGRGARIGDAAAIEFLVRAAGDPDEDVREESLKALQRVASRGDATALAIVLASIDDEIDDVKLQALRSLEHISDVDNAASCQRLVRLLGEDGIDRKLCRAAIEAVAAVTSVGNTSVISQVLALVKEEQVAVRAAGLRALRHITPKGHEEVAAAASRLLEDRDDEVRWAAIRVLRVASEPGTEAHLAKLRAALEDDDDDVREAALQAMAALALPGDPMVLKAAEQCFADVCEDVTCAAIETWQAVAAADQPAENLVALRALLSHEDASVRSRAALALGDLSCKSSPEVTCDLTAALHDEEASVRCAALQSLKSNAGSHTEEMVSSFRTLLVDDSEPVREGALETLLAIVPASSKLCFDLVNALLPHEDTCIRCLGVKGFGQLSHEDAGLACQVLRDLVLATEDADVHCASAEALFRIATGSHDAFASAWEVAMQLCAQERADLHCTGLQALALMHACDINNGNGVEEIILALGDSSQEVRNKAVELLTPILRSEDSAEVSPVVDASSSPLLWQCLNQLEVSQHANSALTMLLQEVWPEGSEPLAKYFSERLEQGDARARRSRVHLLLAAVGPLVAASGSKAHIACSTSAIDAISSRLADSDERVRKAAGQSFGELAGRIVCSYKSSGDFQSIGNESQSQHAVEMLRRLCVASASLLANALAEVRYSAMVALRRVAEASAEEFPEVIHAQTLHHVLEAAKDQDADVRWAASSALCVCASRGDPQAVATASRLAVDEDEQVREAGAKAVGCLAPIGDADATETLRKLLNDNFDVARTALAALLQIFPGKDTADFLGAESTTQ